MTSNSQNSNQISTDHAAPEDNNNELEEDSYVKIESKTRMQRFREFIYDGSTGRFLGRTGISWLQIIVFYIVFYAFLAAFFAVCLIVFMKTLDEEYPKFYGKGSILGNNPGMGYQPWLKNDPESTLIHINTTDPKSYQKYVEQIRDFAKRYSNMDQTRNCTGQEFNGEDGKLACAFSLKFMDNTGCSEANEFGYKDGKPCVILTLNRLIGWQPVAYPQDSVPDPVKGRYDVNTGSVAVDCAGEYFADQEYIGTRSYYPDEGIDWRYFPYRKFKNYHQPFALVKFDSLPRGMLIEVECHAYAYNIMQDQSDRIGMVHFELLID